MFVRMAIDQTVSLHDASDLGRLHVEIAGLDHRAIESALRRHDLGHLEEGGEIALRIAALRRLAGDRGSEWASGFDAMIAYAESRGWVVDGEYVRAHRVAVSATSIIPAGTNAAR